MKEPHLIETEANPDLAAFMEKRASQLNSKKRKLSPSMKSGISGMTLRSRFKKRKLNGEEEDESRSQFGMDDDQAMQGSSYIRYEVIEKKGKQYLVPVRYSIRRAQKMGKVNPDNLEIERQILNNEVDFEYKPSEMEGNFQLNQSAQEIKKHLTQKRGAPVEVLPNEIQEIILVSE